MGVAKLVPPQVVVAEFPLLRVLRGKSPVADQPTATISGSILPTIFGPRLFHGALCPHSIFDRLENAPTEKIPCAAPGTFTVP